MAGDVKQQDGGDVVFSEDDKQTLKDQVGASSANELLEADACAHELAQDAVIKSMSASSAAFNRFRSYAGEKAKHAGGAYEHFAHASELVADLVEVACEEMVEHVPVFGVLMKHGALLGLHGANETEDVLTAADNMIAEMDRERDRAAQAVSPLLEEHKWEIRNAYTSAKETPDKKAAVKATLAGFGIAVPRPDAGARIFQQLVEKLNIDAFIEACRTGKSGKTAECATDGAVPGIKEDAAKEAQKAFPDEEGKKQEKGKAVPIG